MSDEEDLERATVHTKYEWDCPACGNVNDEGDVQPSGPAICPDCGEKVWLE